MNPLHKGLLFLFHLCLCLILTLLTQIGGIVYVLSWLFSKRIRSANSSLQVRFSLRFALFFVLYLTAVLLFVPMLAGLGGRVAMPLFERNIRPHNLLTALFCRNYVRPELRDVALNVAAEMVQKYPGTVLQYLDAQHPFLNGWPLVPHLSHSDGCKLDVALLWKDSQSAKPVKGTPSAIGYGVFVDPHSDEQHRSEECTQKGYWQYGYMDKIVSQSHKADFQLDEARTATMTRLFCNNKQVRRVLIEPFLKKRLNLGYLENLRHQGCNSVRHDDHIHVELRD